MQYNLAQFHCTHYEISLLFLTDRFFFYFFFFFYLYFFSCLFSFFFFFSTVYCVCLKFQFKLNKCEYVRVCVCVECGEIS